MRVLGSAALSHRLTGKHVGFVDMIPVMEATANEWHIRNSPEYRQRSLTDMQQVKQDKPAPKCPTGCGRDRYITEGANPHYSSYCHECHRAISAKRYENLKAKKK